MNRDAQDTRTRAGRQRHRPRRRGTGADALGSPTARSWLSRSGGSTSCRSGPAWKSLSSATRSIRTRSPTGRSPARILPRPRPGGVGGASGGVGGVSERKRGGREVRFTPDVSIKGKKRLRKLAPAVHRGPPRPLAALATGERAVGAAAAAAAAVPPAPRTGHRAPARASTTAPFSSSSSTDPAPASASAVSLLPGLCLGPGQRRGGNGSGEGAADRRKRREDSTRRRSGSDRRQTNRAHAPTRGLGGGEGRRGGSVAATAAGVERGRPR